MDEGTKKNRWIPGWADSQQHLFACAKRFNEKNRKLGGVKEKRQMQKESLVSLVKLSFPKKGFRR